MQTIWEVLRVDDLLLQAFTAIVEREAGKMPDMGAVAQVAEQLHAALPRARQWKDWRKLTADPALVQFQVNWSHARKEVLRTLSEVRPSFLHEIRNLRRVARGNKSAVRSRARDYLRALHNEMLDQLVPIKRNAA